MANINKNIIMQAGAAVANATNKAAGLSAATPEPGSIISAIQLVNGGRTIGPDSLAHFTESVRNKLLSLLVTMEPIQSGSGTPSHDNVRPISGRTGAHVYVSPTSDVADATTYAEDWTSEAGTVYGGTVDVVTGLLTVDRVSVNLNPTTKYETAYGYYWYTTATNLSIGAISGLNAGLISNRLVSYINITDTTPEGQIAFYANGIIRWKEEGSLSKDDYVTYLASNPLQIVYELATPITYQLTPQDIITLVGDNYIWSDSGDVTITE